MIYWPLWQTSHHTSPSHWHVDISGILFILPPLLSFIYSLAFLKLNEYHPHFLVHNVSNTQTLPSWGCYRNSPSSSKTLFVHMYAFRSDEESSREGAFLSLIFSQSLMRRLSVAFLAQSQIRAHSRPQARSLLRWTGLVRWGRGTVRLHG